jgi:hypothetical protein
MRKRSEQHVWITKLVGAVAVGAVSVALVGCGGSSSSDSSTQAGAPASHPQKTAVSSNLDTGVAQTGAGSGADASSTAGGSSSGAGHAGHPSHSKQGDVTHGHHVQRASINPATNDDHNAAITLPNPCKLVSLSEAKTITDGAISATTEAPLGPTCVYQLQGSKGTITMSLEPSSLSQATKHMTRRHEVTVRGRHGFCGKLGTQMLYVPVPGGQVLHITAPCGLGQQFAALALGRLSA